MPNDASNAGFQSVLAPFMDRFLQEKHACGYAYHEPTRILHRLDDFLVQEGLTTLELPRSVARNWLAKKAARKCENPTATDHGRSPVLQVLVAARLSRLRARLHIGCSKSIEFCAQNADSTKSFESSFMPSMRSSLRRVRLCGTSLCRKFSGSCTDAGFVSEKC